MSKAANTKTRTGVIRKRSGKTGSRNKLRLNRKSGESVIAGFDAGTGEGSAQVKTFLKNLSTIACVRSSVRRQPASCTALRQSLPGPRSLCLFPLQLTESVFHRLNDLIQL